MIWYTVIDIKNIQTQQISPQKWVPWLNFQSNSGTYGHNLLAYERDERGICIRGKIYSRVQIVHMNTVKENLIYGKILRQFNSALFVISSYFYFVFLIYLFYYYIIHSLEIILITLLWIYVELGNVVP